MHDNGCPPHPGKALLHIIRKRGVTQSEVARRIGVSFVRINEIVKGKRRLTPDTALRLERFFGEDADFWLIMQRDWDLWHARQVMQGMCIEPLRPT